MSWFRENLDKILLSDQEWKKKYCPFLYDYLFEMAPEQRHEAFLEIIKHPPAPASQMEFPVLKNKKGERKC